MRKRTRKEKTVATGKALNGKPYAGNPHVRFDEGEVASAATPRRGSLLYKLKTIASIASLACALASTAAGHQVVWLDELPIDGMTSGWREPCKNKSVEGNSLQIGSKTFERGVGTHAKSLAVFRVYGKAVAFDADVGIDAEAFADGTNEASVKFVVKAALARTDAWRTA